MALGTLLAFSLLMFTVPLTAFFAASAGRLDPLLAPFLPAEGAAPPSHAQRQVLGGVLGVVTVNAVVLLFLVAAWREPLPPPRNGAKKQD